MYKCLGKLMKKTANSGKTKVRRILCQWNQDSMNAALAEIQDGLISIRKASLKFNIPRGTIQDRIHNRVENGTRIGRPTKLNHDDEQ